MMQLSVPHTPDCLPCHGDSSVRPCLRLFNQNSFSVPRPSQVPIIHAINTLSNSELYCRHISMNLPVESVRATHGRGRIDNASGIQLDICVRAITGNLPTRVLHDGRHSDAFHYNSCGGVLTNSWQTLCPVALLVESVSVSSRGRWAGRRTVSRCCQMALKCQTRNLFASAVECAMTPCPRATSLGSRWGCWSRTSSR